MTKFVDYCSIFLPMLKIQNIDKLSGIDTPFYYYDMDLLQETVSRIRALSEKHGIKAHYAIKANSDPRILKLISAEGLGADCVSGYEVQRAAECGFAPSEIMFAGVGKTDSEIITSLEIGIGCFNVESLPELEVISSIAEKRGVKAPVALRINPNIDAHTHKYITTGLEENKFGISEFEFQKAVDFLRSHAETLDFKGLQFHIGSQITDVENVFKLECERVSEIVATFESMGVTIKNIDLGGGLGIDYEHPDDGKVADFDTLFGTIAKHLQHRPDQQVHIEPGRAIVAQCGSLISRVVFVKDGQKKSFLILDAGMNDLIRPALYDAYHFIENISSPDGPSAVYDVVGPVCESSDVWGEQRELAESHRGDLIAIRSAGAYGAVMASNYNLRPFAKSVYSDELK